MLFCWSYVPFLFRRSCTHSRCSNTIFSMSGLASILNVSSSVILVAVAAERGAFLYDHIVPLLVLWFLRTLGCFRRRPYALSGYLPSHHWMPRSSRCWQSYNPASRNILFQPAFALPFQHQPSLNVTPAQTRSGLHHRALPRNGQARGESCIPAR